MAAKPLKGYKRLPGSAHRYLTPRGREISEYEYRSRKARKQKDAAGKPIFKNYTAQRRFREGQDFQQLRFNTRRLDASIAVDAGSDLEAAMAELTRDPDFGKAGVFATDAKQNSRLGRLLDSMGAPDWYFYRYWYSETT